MESFLGYLDDLENTPQKYHDVHVLSESTFHSSRYVRSPVECPGQLLWLVQRLRLLKSTDITLLSMFFKFDPR